jgi:hypothetical protein
MINWFVRMGVLNLFWGINFRKLTLKRCNNIIQLSSGEK